MDEDVIYNSRNYIWLIANTALDTINSIYNSRNYIWLIAYIETAADRADLQ